MGVIDSVRFVGNPLGNSALVELDGGGKTLYVCIADLQNDIASCGSTFAK